MRLVFALVVACAVSSCLITGGPDCTSACDKMLACKDLKGTFRLSCSSVQSCFEDVVDCASCVDQHTCDELVAGQCDSLCRLSAPDAGN